MLLVIHIPLFVILFTSLGFGAYGFEPKPLNLPKAPRAACESIIDEASVPQEGPFLVHMSNLQFEIDEDDITNYFKGLKVKYLFGLVNINSFKLYSYILFGYF